MAKSAVTTKKISIPVSESIGKVSGILMVPEKAKAVMVLAHGAGAGMMHRFMVELSAALAGQSIATLRYNFPFTENGKGRPDPPAVAEKTVGAAFQKGAALFPDLPLFAAGKSFGGRMSSHYLSKGSPGNVKGIIFYGFPLHPPGNPSVERANHLMSVTVPMLFLQGTKDALANLALITKVCEQLPLARLVTFEGADHSFKSGKKEFIGELAGETAGWIAEKSK